MVCVFYQGYLKTKADIYFRTITRYTKTTDSVILLHVSLLGRGERWLSPL